MIRKRSPGKQNLKKRSQETEAEKAKPVEAESEKVKSGEVESGKMKLEKISRKKHKERAMKLGRRNLFYSLILAGSMLVFLVGYFVYMLPSLYVDYIMEQNLKAVKQQHRAYVESESYAGVQVKNPTACFSIKIPDEGDSIDISSKVFSARVTVEDEQLKEIFSEFRELLKGYDETNKSFDISIYGELFEKRKEEWERIMREVYSETISLPFHVQLMEQQDVGEDYCGEYEKMHLVSDDFVVFEMGVEDSNNKYVNYIAVEKTESSLIFSFLPVMTPEMNEIRPVVMQSLPMLGAIIILLVLVFSKIYSKGIVAPIVRLVWHTQQMKNSRSFEVQPVEEKPRGKGDEIGMLAAMIDDLYRQIRASYQELEKKNHDLEEENKRQEILLRASSHQLKTPISAALLLVDGMKSKIGKYKDTDKYLPKVKEQLLSMKKMVEDILYLNHCGQDLDFQNVELCSLFKKQLSFYRIAIADRQLKLCQEGPREVVVYTDETILVRILENLLSNAVNYTPVKGKIRIIVEESRDEDTDATMDLSGNGSAHRGIKLMIQNFGVRVDEDILPHVFEPFVSGSHDKKENGMNSHGLGLYIASYYAKRIGAAIDIYNEEESVVTVLRF